MKYFKYKYKLHFVILSLSIVGAISSCTLHLFLFGSKKKKDAVPIWAKNDLSPQDYLGTFY
jgi:hypothetical protein